MLKSLFKLILISTVLLQSLASFADPTDRDFHRGQGGKRGNEGSKRPHGFGHGKLSHAGNGCPDGTMRVVFSTDDLSFSILFDKFIVDTTTGAGPQNALVCDIILPMTIPAGMQMEITRVDYRGFVSLQAGARGQLGSVFNFVGTGKGPNKERDKIKLRYSFQGPVTENYIISTGDMKGNKNITQTEISPCGGEAQLRIRNQINIMSKNNTQSTLTVDSIDGNANNIVYYVNWKTCDQAPSPVILPSPAPVVPVEDKNGICVENTPAELCSSSIRACTFYSDDLKIEGIQNYLPGNEEADMTGWTRCHRRFVNEDDGGNN